MTTTPPLSPEARAIAAGIANDIRTHGHLTGGSLEGHWSRHRPEGKCCILFSPTWDANRDPRLGGSKEGTPLHEFSEALKGKTGVGFHGDWNDNTPTEDVLDVLDALAACG